MEEKPLARWRKWVVGVQRLLSDRYFTSQVTALPPNGGNLWKESVALVLKNKLKEYTMKTQKTQVCKTFKLGSDPRVTQKDSIVCLSFFVEGEEIAIEFGTNHASKLRGMVRKLHKIAKANKAIRQKSLRNGLTKRPRISPRTLPNKKEEERLIVAIDF